MHEQGSPPIDAVGMSHQQTENSSLRWRRLVPSPTSLFLLIFFIISLLMNGGLNPAARRGFFCNDTTIQYPYKSDTVSFKMLLVIALFIPSVIIKLLERRLSVTLKSITFNQGTRYRKDSDANLGAGKDEGVQLMTPASGDNSIRRLVVNDDNDSDIEVVNESTNCDNSPDGLTRPSPSGNFDNLEHTIEMRNNFRRIVRESTDSFKSFSDVQIFFFGFIATSFLTGVGKMTCGRLRPHFVERCKPDTDCTLPSNLYKYIENFKCTNEALRPRDLSYITTSWPSGHASIVFFAMLYLVFYLNIVISVLMELKRMRRPSKVAFLNPLVFYSIYTSLIGLAAFVALTRVADYHHHPLDVLSGCILGSITAIVIGNYLLRPRFKPIRDFLKCSQVT